MSITELRRQIKKRVDALSPERLQSAADFLAYLEERESNDATQELLRIPGLRSRIRKAEQDAAAGRVTNWRKVFSRRHR